MTLWAFVAFLLGLWATFIVAVGYVWVWQAVGLR